MKDKKLVNSERGVHGGYSIGQLARAPELMIFVIAEIVTDIDGRPAMTECSRNEDQCEHDTICSLWDN